MAAMVTGRRSGSGVGVGVVVRVNTSPTPSPPESELESKLRERRARIEGRPGQPSDPRTFLDLQRHVAMLSNLIREERLQFTDAFDKLKNKFDCDMRANEDFIRYVRAEKDRVQAKLEAVESERKSLLGLQQASLQASKLELQEKDTALEQMEAANVELQAGLKKKDNELAEALAALQMLEAKDQQLQEKEAEGIVQSPASPDVPVTSSENRLRNAMVDSSSSSTQLKDAINAVESLLGEARRELKNKQLRERRAAFEQLHAALEANDENDLAQAVAAARAAEVEAEDIQKAEAKLLELQSRTDEDKKAQAAQVLQSGQKKDAFHYVKKDNVDAVRTILESLDDNVRWQDWRDYCGRTLQSYAREMKADQVSDLLAAMMSTSTTSPRSVSLDEDDEAELEKPAGDVNPDEEDYFPSNYNWMEEKVSTEATEEAQEPEEVEEVEELEEPPTSLSQEEQDALKKEAFRNVVQDKMQELDDVLAKLPVRIWSSWENKAGRDLITLSQERGSSGAYCILAKRLGMLQEMKKESFEERQDVWIFLPGEVQPVRATVQEDSPEDQDDVLIEYWDGNEPATRIEKCLVRRLN